MLFDDIIENRRSIRKFKSKDVNVDDVMEMIDAARQAPNSGNLQATRYILIKDEERIAELANICFDQQWIAEAPMVVVLISLERDIQRHFGDKVKHYAAQDCACAAMTMMYKATEIGLSTCFVSSFQEEQLCEFLTLEEGIYPHVVMPIGYSNELPDHKILTQMQHLVLFETYRSDIENWDVAMYNWSGIMRDAANKILKKVKKKVKQEKSFKQKFRERLKAYDEKMKDFYEKRS